MTKRYYKVFTFEPFFSPPSYPGNHAYPYDNFTHPKLPYRPPQDPKIPPEHALPTDYGKNPFYPHYPAHFRDPYAPVQSVHVPAHPVGQIFPPDSRVPATNTGHYFPGAPSSVTAHKIMDMC